MAKLGSSNVFGNLGVSHDLSVSGIINVDGNLDLSTDTWMTSQDGENRLYFGDSTGFGNTVINAPANEAIQMFIDSTTPSVDPYVFSISQNPSNCEIATSVFQTGTIYSTGSIYANNTDLVWHEGNDGSGSGLDADTVDGVQGSQFLRSDTFDVKTAGDLRFNDSVDLHFGTDADFRMYNTGSDMWLRSYASGHNVYFYNRNADASYVYNMVLDNSISGGSFVDLRYNSTRRLTTTSGGIDVTGSITFSGQSGSLDYDEDTVALGGDFGVEQVKCVRIGNQVTITGVGALSHSSSVGPASTSGVIPSQYRPTGEDSRNIFYMDSSYVAIVRVQTTGTFSLVYRDWTGSVVSRVSTTPPTITYNV